MEKGSSKDKDVKSIKQEQVVLLLEIYLVMNSVIVQEKVMEK